MWYDEELREIFLELYCLPCQYEVGSSLCMACKYDPSGWVDIEEARELQRHIDHGENHGVWP